MRISGISLAVFLHAISLHSASSGCAVSIIIFWLSRFNDHGNFFPLKTSASTDYCCLTYQLRLQIICQVIHLDFCLNTLSEFLLVILGFHQAFILSIHERRECILFYKIPSSYPLQILRTVTIIILYLFIVLRCLNSTSWLDVWITLRDLVVSHIRLQHVHCERLKSHCLGIHPDSFLLTTFLPYNILLSVPWMWRRRVLFYYAPYKLLSIDPEQSVPFVSWSPCIHLFLEVFAYLVTASLAFSGLFASFARTCMYTHLMTAVMPFATNIIILKDNSFHINSDAWFLFISNISFNRVDIILIRQQLSVFKLFQFS